AGDADQVMDGLRYIQAPTKGGAAVLFDQDHGPTVYGLADLMARQFENLVLVTPRPGIGQNVNYCSAIGVHRRLHQAGVEILPSHELIDFRDARVTLRNVFIGAHKTLEKIDQVVFATPRLANDALVDKFGDIPVHAIGDCHSPRNLMAAIHGGHIVGAAL
ncbi:MAG: hypothetical protein OSB82_17555, partial [Alphaproteobacteria bacterium]|nr:hypothetical protein [Alphaproteobacteria bacterium]